MKTITRGQGPEDMGEAGKGTRRADNAAEPRPGVQPMAAQSPRATSGWVGFPAKAPTWVAVCSPAGVCTGGKRPTFLAHIRVSLPPPPPTLPVSLSPVNTSQVRMKKLHAFDKTAANHASEMSFTGWADSSPDVAEDGLLDSTSKP